MTMPRVRGNELHHRNHRHGRRQKLPNSHENENDHFGIFSLSTPFKMKQTHSANCKNNRNNDGADDSDMNSPGNGDNHDYHGSHSAKKFSHYNYGDDDSVTTLGGDYNNTQLSEEKHIQENDDFSVDLLADNSVKSARHSDTNSAVGDGSHPVMSVVSCSQDYSKDSPKKQFSATKHQQQLTQSPSPLSPATLTLDRLANFGSQEGGAELSVHLLHAAAEKQTSKVLKLAAENQIQKDFVDFEQLPANKANQLMQSHIQYPQLPQQQRHQEMSQQSDFPAQNITNIPQVPTTIQNHLKIHPCIHELKNYFMSTNNSSSFAQNYRHRPIATRLFVPFCHSCQKSNRNSVEQLKNGTQLPHHGLCPKHNDFYNSGSYEILNLLVDGNLIGCKACQHQWDNGRPNKHLEHDLRCERRNKWKGGDDSRTKHDIHQKSQDIITKENAHGKSNLRSCTGQFNHLIPIEDAAKSGCRKCQLELSTGKKNSKKAHDSMCPRKRVINNNGKRKSNDAMTRCISLRKEESPSKACSQSQPRVNSNVEEKRDIHPKFNVGTIVYVQPRTWPGTNKPGGVARVMKVHSDVVGEDEEYSPPTYDVSYVLELRRERGVDEAFLSLHTDYISPLKDKQVNKESSLLDEGKQHQEISRDNSSFHFEKSHPHVDKGKNEKDETFLLSKDDRTKRSMKLHDNGCDSKESNTLSDYELLRLRNIERNEARLAQLGLLNTSAKKTQQTKTCGKRKLSSTIHSDNSTTGTSSRTISYTHSRENQKKSCKNESNNGRKKDTPHDGIRNQETLEVDNGTSINGAVKAKPIFLLDCRDKRGQEQYQTKSSSTVSSTFSSEATLIQGAKAGCKKCTLEWQTEKKDLHGVHDMFCPLRLIQMNNESQAKLSCISSTHKNGPDQTPPVKSRNINDVSKERLKAQAIISTVTPSPVVATPQPPEYLASFIADFTSKGVVDEEIPTPNGSKWFPCSNPWGKLGYEDGDFVVISPFQSETPNDLLSVFHQGLDGGMPKRFAINTLKEYSPYHTTHRSPARGGYSVLRLLRDRMALIPWGFTVRNHEFGGACLVDSIEPLSPAESAEDVSGWTDEKMSSSLCIHDMIVCINGKSVGGMTEIEFQIELDICGPEMILVVARYDKLQDSIDVGGKDFTLNDLDMEWVDIGAGTGTTVKKRVSFGVDHRGNKPMEDVASYDKSNGKHSGHSSQSVDSTLKNERHAMHHQSWNTLSEKIREEKFPVSNNLNKKHGIDESKTPARNSCSNIDKKLCIKRSWDSQRKKDKSDKLISEGKTVNIEEPHKVTQQSRSKNSSFESKENNTLNLCETEIVNKQCYDRMKSNNQSSVTKSKNGNPFETNMMSPACVSDAVSKYRRQLEELEDSSSEDDKIQFKTLLNSDDSMQNGNQDIINNELSSNASDENPWLGCVCGETHPHPIKVFWIQCESCYAWYNVAEKCVGFDSKTAESLKEWICFACNPPVAGLEF